MKKGINVLSCFDGISCGQLSLKQLGIKVNNYYASEIEESSITITKKNFPNTIHLGDIRKVKSTMLPKIDLLIAGSPCQGFSFAGKCLKFDDPRSKLFFEFLRLYRSLKPKYFLLENVRMDNKSMEVISKYLKVKPILINSSLLTAQNRERLYWTNIPNVIPPEDQKITLNQVIDEPGDWRGAGYRGVYNPTHIKDGTSKYVATFQIRKDQKSNCLITTNSTAKIYDLNTSKSRYLSVEEMEKLQSLPIGYTSGVSNTKRMRMIGNGWTVSVINHILKNMDL